ncbi:MAG: sensor histidine kinase, partial [Cyanobacteriota bacterium]
MTLQQLRNLLAEGVPPGTGDEDSVRRHGGAARATLQEDLLPGADVGVWLAAPLPALYEPSVLQTLRGWVWAPPEMDSLLPAPPLLPGR